MDVRRWDIFVEEVTHTVHENAAWFAPLQRLVETRRNRVYQPCPVSSAVQSPGRAFVSVADRLVGISAKAMGFTDGIAVVAAGTDLGTSGDRIPGCFCPLD